MSITEMYAAFELEYANICEEERYDRTNYGESMPLSTYMEGHGAGFSIRDSEEEIIIDNSGVESVLRGFHENPSPETNIYVQEILDTIGPDSETAAGPFDLECNFTLEDYIMFRDGRVYGKKFTTWGKDADGNDIPIEHENVIEFNFSPVEAIEMAQMVFAVNKARTEDDHWTASNRAVQLHRLSEEKEWGQLHRTYLSWALRNLHVHMDTFKDDTTGFEYHYEPIVESQDAVIDATMTRQQADDLCYHDGEEERKRAEERYWDCFSLNEETGKMEKQLCSEEFSYRKMKKEERELRTQNILAWIKRNDPKTVAEAFHKRGEFHKNLQKSRSTCLPPTGSYRTTFKSAIEVWLTKQQADLCMKAAEERIKEAK